MLNNLINKRLFTLNNTKKLFLNSQPKLYSYSNKNRLFSTNSTNPTNSTNSTNSTNPTNSTNSTNSTNNDEYEDRNYDEYIKKGIFLEDDDGQTRMYKILKHKMRETEKELREGLKMSDEEFFKGKSSSKQIFLSRHGTITLAVALAIFTATAIFFYFGKRKHILLSQQVDYHTTAITNELNQLTSDNQKIYDSLSSSQNQDQLITLLIDKILIEKGILNNNNNNKSITPAELNKIKSELKSIIVNSINK
ncbi:hypothetical protein ACTFIW_009796 [Dictyostelium discoideum]